MSQQPYQPPMPPRPPKRGNTKKIALIVLGSVVGLFIVLAVIGAIIGPPKTSNTASQTIVVTKSASPSPAPMTSVKPSPKPAPTTAKPAPTHAPTKAKPAAAPSPTGCGKPDDRDVYVWYKVPGIEDSAQRLGELDLANCTLTVDSVIATSPTGAGYCTEVGYVDQNPGYDPDATPAKPLKNIANEIGGGC